jgi:hypothetical protein
VLLEGGLYRVIREPVPADELAAGERI